MLALWLSLTHAAPPSFPRQVGLIDYDTLWSTVHTREVAWTNPDGSADTLTLHELVIPTPPAIREATRTYVRENHGRDTMWLEPRMVVLHSMDLGDLRTSLEASSFLHHEMPPSWGKLPQAGSLPNGAHFMVDAEGTIFVLTPPEAKNGTSPYYGPGHRWLVRRHQDGNPVAIGIEHLTPHNRDYTDVTGAQIAATTRLVRWLVTLEGGAIDYVIGHHELVVAEAHVGKNLVMKRIRARARGRAARIQKPFAQMTIILRDTSVEAEAA